MIPKPAARAFSSRRKSVLLLVVLGAAVFWPACGVRTERAADLVLTNALVYTADAQGTRAEAVAIRGGMIARPAPPSLSGRQHAFWMWAAGWSYPASSTATPIR